ncbi:hypothetical protein GW17_00006847 [Ensete ventricosum]|nr:hypothetical protein GW17_00006847 [Ensete ventricosum]RZS08941.1 hypothetical protein BHM03_00039980 [Ensete ventricosum]
MQFISSGMLCPSMFMVRLEMIVVTCFQQFFFFLDSVVSTVVNFISYMYMTGESEDEDLMEPVFDFEVRNTFWNYVNFILSYSVARQAKYLRQKFGGDDDEMDDHEEEEEEERKAIWGRRKSLYYNADNVDYEVVNLLQSSDEDLPMEEEAEVLKIQREKAKSLSMEDFGLVNNEQDESDSDRQNDMHQQDALVEKTAMGRSAVDDDNSYENYEEIKKDFTDLTKEEQMDVVYRYSSFVSKLVNLF